MIRAIAAAVLATVALGTAAPAALATTEQECGSPTHPCYECVVYPCYPDDWPPFLLSKVQEILDGLS